MSRRTSVDRMMRSFGFVGLIPVVCVVLLYTCSRDKTQPKEAGAPAETNAPTSLAAQLIPLVQYAGSLFGDSAVPALEPFLALLDSSSHLLPATSPLLTPAAKFDAIRRLVYETWAIRFDQDQYRVCGMFPHTTLASGRGSCLGVSLLFLLLAERLELPVYGVVLPGHFFVRFDDGNLRFNAEPNRQGYRYTDEQYRTKYLVGADSWYDLRNLGVEEVVAVVKYNLGNICRRTGKLDAAAELYKQAGGEFPGFSEAFGNLGLTFDLLGEYEQAVGALLKAKSVRSDMENISRNLGTVYLKMGRIAQAIREYEDGLLVHPGDPDLLYGLALARFRSGDVTRARQEIDTVLKSNPAHSEARKLLGEIERRGNTRG